MPFDAEEAELLAATQLLCRWSSSSDESGSSSGSVSALPSTVESLRSIELFLRRDHPTLQPHHLSIGRWQTVQTALLPLMATYKRDREVVYPTLKLIVRLTMPLPPAAPDAEQPQHDARRERMAHQMQIRNALLEGVHLDVLMQWLTPLLARPPAVRSGDDVNIIELSLTLIKNLLAVSAGTNTQPNAAAEDAAGSKAEAALPSHGRQVGERIIRRYADCGLLDMLGAVCWQPEDLEKFGLLLLETVALIVGGVSVDELVLEKRKRESEEEERRRKERSAIATEQQAAHGRSGSNFSYLWKSQPQPSTNSSLTALPSLPSSSSSSSSSPSSLGWQLQTARLNEKTRYVAPSRHSRFGTLLTLPSPLSSSMDAELSAPPVSSGNQLVRNMFDMRAVGSDSMPAFRGRTPRHAHTAAVPSMSGERSVCVELVEFVVAFVSDGCYQRLTDSALRELKTNVRVVREDEKNWMAVAALMMGVWREQQTHNIELHNKTQQSSTNSDPSPTSPPAPYFECAPVMSCLSATAFSLLTSKLLLYIQEKPSPLPFLTASLQLYSEIVHTLSCMLRYSSPADRELANQLRHAFYYEKEQLDLLVSLMRQWNAHSWGGPLMALLVECVHWSMAMLDDVDGTHTISQRKKRRQIKNKTVLVNGEKQKMPIAELQQALPANIILDVHKLDQQQRQQQEEERGGEEQHQAVPVMAVVVATPVQPAAPCAADQRLTEDDSQQALQESSAEDENEQTQHPSPRQQQQSIETQADTVVYEAETTESPPADDAPSDSIDTQQTTLPLPVDSSIDSTADTIVIPASTHGADTTATLTGSVDSEAATQLLLSGEQQDEEMAEDCRAKAAVLQDNGSGTLDSFATQLLPSEEELQSVDGVSEIDTAAPTVQESARSQSRTALPASDVSDASLSTLVSEMAIQPPDIVMDSILPDDANSSNEQARQLHNVEQPSSETQPHLSAEATERSGDDDSMANGETSTDADSSSQLVQPVDVSPDSAVAQRDQFDFAASKPASTDEELLDAAVPVVAVAAVPVTATVVATVVAMPAVVADPDSASTSNTPVAATADGVEAEEDTDEDGYFRMESTFNFSAYVLSYANPTILSHYLSLLAGYRTNSTALNSHIVHFLARIAFDRQLMPLLFQLSFLQLCDAILNDPLLKAEKNLPRWKELTGFCKKIVRGLFDFVEKEPRGEMMFVECLFWKSVNAVELIRGGYRGGGGGDGMDADEDDADRPEQDEEAWKAEIRAQIDGDWQPGKQSDPEQVAVKKTKNASRKKKKSEAAKADEGDDVDDAGEEIDIAQLMDEQAKKEKDRTKREKKEQKRREAEAREKEKDRQRRVAMAAEDDDEAELQLGEYNEQEAEERRRREQRERDDEAEAEGADKEWRADEEELLRGEYPTFAALKSRYALMGSRLKSRFTQDEVKRKIQQMGLDKGKTEKVAANDDAPTSPSPRPQLRVETDMHTATTDEEQSEHDPSEMQLTTSPLPPLTPTSESAPASSPSAIAATPRGSRAPSGASVDVKSITGHLYDMVSDMARHKHHHAFIQHSIYTLTACAQQRQQHGTDWKHFTAATLSPTLPSTDSSAVDSEKRLRRQRQLLSCMALVRVSGGAWSVQRQYSADKLEAVVATIERAYENTIEGLLPDAVAEEEEVQEDDVAEEQAEQSADEQQQNDSDDEDADQAASTTSTAAPSRKREMFIPLVAPRETRKRTAAQLSAITAGDEGDDHAAAGPQLLHAEDEMDDAELADFLRERRNRARTAPQRTQLDENKVEPPAVASRAVRGRLRKVAADEMDQREDSERIDKTAELLITADVSSSTAVAPDLQAEPVTVTKRRRLIVDDDEEEDMDMT